MEKVYFKIRSAITLQFQDLSIISESCPTQDPEFYECRLAVNSGTPFAILLAKNAPGELTLFVFPSISSDYESPHTVFEIFDNNGVRFTMDKGEGFIIRATSVESTVSVFQVIPGVDIDYGFKTMEDDIAIENIMTTLLRINSRK